jgi:uncharacterized protein
MELWSAFFLGLVGSVHCAGMCGPLALAVPVCGSGGWAVLTSRVIYNAGRISTYMLLGALAGAAGKTLALAGLQRWIALGSGLALLLFALASIAGLSFGAAKPFAFARRAMPFLLRKPTSFSVYALGVLNGLLPCGLAYAACIAAGSGGSLQRAVIYMAFFGLGTLPVLLAFGLAGPWMRSRFKFRIPHLAATVSILLAGVLIIRGLSLGSAISPDLSSGHPVCPACSN